MDCSKCNKLNEYYARLEKFVNELYKYDILCPYEACELFEENEAWKNLTSLDFESVDEFFDKYKEKLDNKNSTPRENKCS